MDLASYHQFLATKVASDGRCGFACGQEEINRLAKPHQRDIICWAVQGGRRAIFTAFGLGKTIMQLEIARLILKKIGSGRALIVMPLGVRQEFKRDAAMLGTPVIFVRSHTDARADGIYLTNYESLRDGKFDPTGFKVVSFDEAAFLRSFGSKTFGEMIFGRVKNIPYRFVATAVPSPNDFLELLGYSACLGIMDIGEAKTRFFRRNSEKSDALTLHPNKEREFWLWLSSWAIFLQKPSDLGYSDEGYDLPDLDIRWHEIPSDFSQAGTERDGQGRLVSDTAIGVTEASREKRHSLAARMAKLMEIRAEDPRAHRLIWHDLEAERHAIEKMVPECATIYGSQDLDDREATVIKFSEGEIQELAAKPIIAGSGCNFQRHCSWAIFLGIGFKFNDFIQAIHRIHRFLQPGRVRLDLIYTEAERRVRRTLERKWTQYNQLVQNMTEIIREYGLHGALRQRLTRTTGVTRREESGQVWHLVNNDAVEETAAMGENTVDLVLTSIPFSGQYEYTPSYNDFGHTDDDGQFFGQMDFLSPELYRVLRPGRVMAVHVKDRICPGVMTGNGFQTVNPFHAECIFHWQKHGFAYGGMITVVTDVVRENNQTYRLGWTEQCKDGSRMGVGMPEYVLLFRKPPTDRSNGYADLPVRKSKQEYSLARWQIDAHAFWRSNGDRLLRPQDLDGLSWSEIYKAFRNHSLNAVYDFPNHVAIGERLRDQRRLPIDFMLLPPQSWQDDVWTDVTRMRTLNGNQSRRGKQFHICPLQFDIVERLVKRYSNPGDLVYDPFAGLGTVPVCAVKLGRCGKGTELNQSYFADSVYYLKEAEAARSVPTLFNLEENLAASEEST